MWSASAALLPVILVSVVFSGWHAVRVLALSTGSAAAFGWLCERKRHTLFSANVLIGILLAVMLPLNTPWWMIFLGAFFAVVLTRECFGGLGHTIFHPAAVGYLSLTLLFPNRPVWEQALSGNLTLFALWASGLILLGMRRIPWQVPLLYLLTLAACFFSAGTNSLRQALPAPAWFAALFLVSDPETTPITKNGKAIFAVCAALLTGFGAGRTHFLEASAAAVLLMNGAAPVIDRWVRPGK
jgi:electron transport complex protein RnfD